MLSSRIAIYSEDEGGVRPWVGAAAATGGTVDVIKDITTLDPRSDLVIAELPPAADKLLGKLGEMEATASAVVIVPSPELGVAIQQLRIPSVRAVLVKDYVSQRLLTGVSARLLRGNIFGISKTVPWGTRVYSEIVGSHDDRLQALATLSRFTSGLKLRAKYREAIDVVADELLMNGLYDAPIDAEGKAVFGEVAPGERTGVRLERPAVLQFASDGSRVVVAVRDSFGSLKRPSVLENLERCAQAGEQIDRKTAGAGLGLYLVANHVTELMFNILPGVATEVACVIDVMVPRQQLKHIGFYEESVQGAEQSTSQGGQLVAMGGQPRGSNRTVHLTLVVALLLLVVAGLLMVWPYIHKPPRGSLKVTTEPAGAVVRVNGIRRGVANPDLEVKDVEVDRPCNVSATLEGYGVAEEVVKLKKGQSLPVRLQLRVQRAKLRVSSSPQGAQVFVDDKDTGQKTPTVLEDLEPGKELNIEMKMHGFGSSAGMVKPEASQTLIYHAKLTLAGGFAMIGLDSKPPGARLLINDVDTGEVTPIPGFVVRGGQEYVIKLLLADRVPWSYTWTAKEGDRLVKSVELPEGGRLSMTANTPAVVTIGARAYRLPLKGQLVPAGMQSVRLRSRNPALDYSFRMSIGPGKHVTRQLTFGFVKVEPKKWRIKLPGLRPAAKAALRPGPQEITVVDRKGTTRKIAVDVKPRATVTVDVSKLQGGPAPKKAGKKSRKPPTKKAAKKPPAKKPPAKKPPAKKPPASDKPPAE